MSRRRYVNLKWIESTCIKHNIKVEFSAPGYFKLVPHITPDQHWLSDETISVVFRTKEDLNLYKLLDVDCNLHGIELKVKE